MYTLHHDAAGTGKSSLVTAFITQEFSDNVPSVVAEVTIPPDVTLERTTTHIVDSPSDEASLPALKEEILKADVICIVYAFDNQETINRVSSYWIPFIRSLVGVEKIPIVLVGNKSDLGSRSDLVLSTSGIANSIMDSYQEIDTCVECSAKTLQNIAKVFHFAQKAVLYPTGPLYDSATKQLKPDCEAALKRIFKLCDLDKDGFLNDDEINGFQKKSFGKPLQQRELEGVKEVVSEQHSAGVTPKGLTEEGFLFLHKLFIQRGRVETTWLSLHKFGYGNDLKLRDDFLHPHLDLDGDCFVELTPDGYQFFINLFKTCDKDNDGALSPTELEHLFETSPGNPFAHYCNYHAFDNGHSNHSSEAIASSFAGSGSSSSSRSSSLTSLPSGDVFQCAPTTNEGWITLQGFLALWSMVTSIDIRTTLEYLAYLGYPNDTKTAIKVTHIKRPEQRRKKSARNTFLVYVFGATGCGKSSLLRSFVGKEFRDRHIPTTRSNYAVNSVSVQGADKYLVLQEVPANGPDFETIKNRKRMDACALAVFVYDSSDPNSFAYAESLQTQIEDPSIPCLLIAAKTDLPQVNQIHHTTPADFCLRSSLPPPFSFSAASGQRDVFAMIAHVVMNPQIATKPPVAEPMHKGVLRLIGLSAGTPQHHISLPSRLLRFSVFVGVVAGSGYAVYKYINTSKVALAK